MRRTMMALCAAAALSAFCSCARQGPSAEQLRAYGEAKASYAAGRLADAERALRPLAKNQALPQARFLLGKSLFFLGRHEEAATVFKDIGERFPKYHEADIWLARAYLQQGRVDESDKVARELLANDSGDFRIHYLAAMVRVAQGDFVEALAFLERASESGEELAKSDFESARIYYRFGQDDKAIERLARAEAALPPTGPTREAVAELTTRLRKRGAK